MKKRWIFATLAVVAVAGSWAVLGSRGETHAQAAAGGPPEVTVAQVLVRAVNDSIAVKIALRQTTGIAEILFQSLEIKKVDNMVVVGISRNG